MNLGEWVVQIPQHTQYLDPGWVAQVTGGRRHEKARPASDLAWDSRSLTPGSAFVALPGQRTHGNAFLEDALARGAAFLLTDLARPEAVEVADPYRALILLGRALRRRFSGPVVAVSGSVGKTTTKESLARALGYAATAGNLNTVPALARFFLHLNPKAKGAVVELGIDRVGEMDDLVELTEPEIGVLTAIAPAHLEAFRDLQTVAREKGKLLTASKLKIAEVGAARWLDLEGVRTYGFHPEADFQGHDLRYGLWGTRFVYRGKRVHLPYPGLGPALGALAALAVTEILGQSISDAIERLGALRLPSGRLEVIHAKDLTIIHDAYNANPASVQSGLELLKQVPGRKVVVLGTMLELGESAPAHHQSAARAAAAVADELIFVGDFAEAMQKAAGRGSVARSVAEAAKHLQRVRRPGDVVYLKASRGLRLERLLEVIDG